MADPILPGQRAKIPLQEYHAALAGRDWTILHVGLMLTAPDETAYFGNALPYGVALWPAAIALAHELAARADALRGKRVLELGAGTGLPGLVAAHVGAQVVQTDYQDEALMVCGLNARRNGIGNVSLRQVDWTDWNDTDQYDFIIGSDILYGERLHPSLRHILTQNLAPGGRVLLTDPLRRACETFMESLDREGWDISAWNWKIGEGAEERSVCLFDLTPGPDGRPKG